MAGSCGAFCAFCGKCGRTLPPTKPANIPSNVAPPGVDANSVDSIQLNHYDSTTLEDAGRGNNIEEGSR